MKLCALVVLPAFLFGQLPPNPTKLSSAMPADAPPVPKFDGGNFIDVQRKFDIFAWQEFVAANWPPGQPGQPGPGTIGNFPGGDNPTVWETYMADSQVFQPGAKPPSPWGTPQPIPSFCPAPPPALKAQVRKVFALVAKSDLQDEFLEAFTPYPLFDVNGNYTRYEIRMNQAEFNQILAGTPGTPGIVRPWYNPANQIAPIVFPAGVYNTNQIGAMEFKAAWRPITDAEKPRYHSSYSYVTYAPDPKTGMNTKCAGPYLMGLVGLHIAHKTTSAPQWVWATFEHVDNDPDAQSTGSGKKYSYYNNPKCTFSPACADLPPSGSTTQWDGDPTKKFPPVQVIRATPIPSAKNDPKTGINPVFQQLLRAVNPASVWQYYQLVDTQWPQRPGTVQNPNQCYHTTPLSTPINFACSGPKGDQGPGPVPGQLTNTTAETYFQAAPGNKQAYMGSCMGCHSNATVASGAPNPNVYSDFSFLMGEAQPVSKAPNPPRVRRKKP